MVVEPNRVAMLLLSAAFLAGAGTISQYAVAQDAQQTNQDVRQIELRIPPDGDSAERQPTVFVARSAQLEQVGVVYGVSKTGADRVLRPVVNLGSGFDEPAVGDRWGYLGQSPNHRNFLVHMMHKTAREGAAPWHPSKLKVLHHGSPEGYPYHGVDESDPRYRSELLVIGADDHGEDGDYDDLRMYLFYEPMLGQRATVHGIPDGYAYPPLGAPSPPPPLPPPGPISDVNRDKENWTLNLKPGTTYRFAFSPGWEEGRDGDRELMIRLVANTGNLEFSTAYDNKSEHRTGDNEAVTHTIEGHWRDSDGWKRLDSWNHELSENGNRLVITFKGWPGTCRLTITPK